MRRNLIYLVIVVAMVIWGSANMTLQASPLPQATATVSAGWGMGALMRVKPSIAFSWLRATPSASGRILVTIQPGDYVILNATAPVWDGVQWWWKVRWGNVNGYVEQDSLELVIAAPTAGPGATQGVTAVAPTAAAPTVAATTAVPAGGKANWPASTIVRIKLTVPFAWLRAAPSSTSGPADYAPTGDTLMIISSFAVNDGTQWWWQVRRVKGTILGYVEQNSVEPVAVAVINTPTPIAAASTPTPIIIVVTSVPTAGAGTPVATVSGAAPAATWTVGTLHSVQDKLPFAWVRAQASAKAGVVATLYPGWLVMIRNATPVWDGTQWWWNVFVPAFNAQGWIEQSSLF